MCLWHTTFRNKQKTYFCEDYLQRRSYFFKYTFNFKVYFYSN